MSRVLLLRAATAGEVDGEGGVEVVCGCAGPVRKEIEHAGHAYQEKLRLLFGRFVEEPEAEAGAADKGEDDADADEPEEETSAAWKLKRLASKYSDDAYELLELGDRRWRATEDEVKKAFRKMSLKYHPDKLASSSEVETEEAEEHFKKVIKAYDLLSDKKKRAAYDSVDDVDDSIPSEREINDDNFYKKLGQVFEYNARWSTSNRMRKLGDAATEYKEVMKFYDDWFNFKSWREFTMNQEYDPDQAEYREERRWMERQNGKAAKAAKVAEMARIRRLVEMAYKMDPRVRKQREDEKRAKEQAKEEKRRKKEEAERVAREEEERIQREKDEREAREREASAVERKERERAKKLLRKTKQRVRAAAAPATESSVQMTANVEVICGRLEYAALVQFAERLEACDPDGVDALIREELRGSEAPGADGGGANGTARAAGKAEAETNGPPPAVWTADEQSLLAKAIAKYPGGTRDRWSKIAQLVQSKTAAECLAKVNSTKTAATKTVSTKDSAALAQANAGNGAQNGAHNNGTKEATENAGGEVAKEPTNGGVPPNRLNFSKKQQAALEAAMKKYGADTGADRWLKVASQVPSKNAGECEARYKELVSFYRSRKAQK